MRAYDLKGGSIKALVSLGLIGDRLPVAATPSSPEVAAAPSPQHANRRSIQPLPHPGGEGTVLGVIVALCSTSVLRSVLYEVSALDASIFLFVTLILAGVALLASSIPARRATKADPMVALGRG